MIAYRAELWCNGCSAHFAKGIPHDDFTQLPQLGRNLVAIAVRDGWVEDGAAHFCPHCQRQRKEEPQSDRRLARICPRTGPVDDVDPRLTRDPHFEPDGLLD